MIALINYISNHSYTLSFYSKNTINLLKIRRNSGKIGKNYNTLFFFFFYFKKI